MKVAYTIVLVILTFLAISSGFAKVLLMPRDVEFFSQYGFTNMILIIFGAVQLIGGILLLLGKTRFVGAAMVASTFLVSLVLLIMDRNVPVSMITIAMTLLLIVVMKQSWKAGPGDS